MAAVVDEQDAGAGCVTNFCEGFQEQANILVGVFVVVESLAECINDDEVGVESLVVLQPLKVGEELSGFVGAGDVVAAFGEDDVVGFDDVGFVVLLPAQDPFAEVFDAFATHVEHLALFDGEAEEVLSLGNGQGQVQSDEGFVGLRSAKELSDGTGRNEFFDKPSSWFEFKQLFYP